MFNELSNKIREIKNSIVAIGFHPNSDPQKITIIGSGFSISNDGKILTAAHLFKQVDEQKIKIEDLRASVAVESKDDVDFMQYQWKPMTLIKKDDKNDIAVVKVKDYSNSKLEALELGDSDNIKVGESVYFIGFPYAAQLINDGFGVTLIVNRGIISNIKRDGGDPAHPRNFIIIDAISNPGNSGCPLIHMETNKVIGVMSIAFRTQSHKMPDLDIREPMHICAAKPINLTKNLL